MLGGRPAPAAYTLQAIAHEIGVHLPLWPRSTGCDTDTRSLPAAGVSVDTTVALNNPPRPIRLRLQRGAVAFVKRHDDQGLLPTGLSERDRLHLWRHASTAGRSAACSAPLRRGCARVVEAASGCSRPENEASSRTAIPTTAGPVFYGVCPECVPVAFATEPRADERSLVPISRGITVVEWRCFRRRPGTRAQRRVVSCVQHSGEHGFRGGGASKGSDVTTAMDHFVDGLSRPVG